MTEDQRYVIATGEHEGWLAQVVSAAPEGTEPSCELILRVRPGHPNSYSEWVAVMDLLTEVTQRVLGDAMDSTINAMVALHPERVMEAALAVGETVRLNGFSDEEAVESVLMALDLGGEGPS